MSTAIDVFAKVRDHERGEILRAAREADMLPYFRVLESAAAPVVEMEGAERIMLGSNNYLGLTADPRVMGQSPGISGSAMAPFTALTRPPSAI